MYHAKRIDKTSYSGDSRDEALDIYQKTSASIRLTLLILSSVGRDRMHSKVLLECHTKAEIITAQAIAVIACEPDADQ